MFFTDPDGYNSNNKMIEKIDDDGRIAIKLEKCGKCGMLIELFKSPVLDVVSVDSLIYDILYNDELVVKFSDFLVMCPHCREDTEGSTFFRLDEKELELINKTPLRDILVTV